MRVRGHARRLVLLGLLPILVGCAGAGCGKARAEIQPQMPVLEAPPPPPRVFTAREPEPPPPAPVTVAEEEVPVARTPQRPAPARSEPPRTAPAAPTEREPEPAKPEDARAGRTLQTPESGAESERAIRDQLARASSQLQRVDYRSLSASLKEQYDIAKRFVQQAEDALKARNLVYAASLAGKAVEIAEVLPRR